jgi:beta-glucuronidase
MKILKHLFIFLFLFPLITSAQDLITNTFNRNTISLNGTWHYIVDPYEVGYYDYRSKPYDEDNKNSINAFFNDYHPKNKSELIEYNFNESPTLKVPGDWNSQKEKLFYYEGSLWLKRTFNYIPSQKNNRLFVYFGAVNYRADVYLNGTKLGVHEGGFTPFNFEITSIVKPENNFLIVRVNDKRLIDAVPTVNTDWFNYGGITRDVKLIEVPQTFIQDYTIQLEKNDPNTASGFVKLNNVSSPQKVTITIPELKIEKEFVTNGDGYAKINFKVKKINYWSPESPKLYEVFISTPFEKLKDDIGFRTIKVVGQNILLNGKSIYLRGICLHEENTMRGARAFSDADALVSLTWAKELGCNYIRMAHYPHNEHMIRMADKMGMMVWEEIPVYWTIDFTNKATLKNAENQLSEMITRDKNRASVIIWSMANETPPSDARNSFIIDLVNQTRKIDSTRLVSAALQLHSDESKPGVKIVDDPLGNYFDIVAFNQYTGWYGGSLEDAPDSKWEIAFQKPVVISEFGGGAVQGMHGTKDERWTEEYQDY